jgi:MFS family permease
LRRLQATSPEEEGDGPRERKKEADREPVSIALFSPAARRRQIWIIYFIGFMDLFSVSMMIPLYPRLSRLLGASPAVAGLIGSLYGVIQVFSSPLVGKMSDVYGRKKLLLLSYLVPAPGYLLLAMATTYQSLPLLILSKLPTGVFKHGLSVSKAYLSDITEPGDRQAVLGMFNACSSLGFIFGPLISGYLADRDESLRLCMMCGVAVFSLNFFFILFLVRSIPAANVSSSGISGLRDMLTLKYFLSSINIFKGLKWWKMKDLIALRFTASFAVLMFRSNLTIFLQEHFDTDYKTLGKILAFNGIAAAIAAATGGYVSRLYSSTTKQVIHLLVLLAMSLLAATCAPNLLVLVLTIIPQAIATSNLRICTLNLFLSRVSEEDKGEVIGLTYSITSVSRMLSPGLVGVAQEWSSVLSGYVSSGLACVAIVVMVTNSMHVKSSSKSSSSSLRNGPVNCN